MVPLTDVEEIAGLVSGVTEAICGATFVPWDPLARGESLSGRMVLLALEGPRAIRIALSCDSRGSRALAAAMFHCPYGEVTATQINDAIAGLLKIVAGQVQRTLMIDQPIGTPRPTTLAELGGPGINDALLLRSHGDVDIRLWIFEEDAPAESQPTPASISARFRSLIKRITH